MRVTNDRANNRGSAESDVNQILFRDKSAYSLLLVSASFRRAAAEADREWLDTGSAAALARCIFLNTSALERDAMALATQPRDARDVLAVAVAAYMALDGGADADAVRCALARVALMGEREALASICQAEVIECLERAAATPPAPSPYHAETPPDRRG
jgi:hypothetical protein